MNFILILINGDVTETHLRPLPSTLTVEDLVRFKSEFVEHFKLQGCEIYVDVANNAVGFTMINNLQYLNSNIIQWWVNVLTTHS